MIHVDFFSGPGGICTGFKAAGLRTVVAIEKVESCVQTYSSNHPEVAVIHNDIRNVSVEELRERLGNEKVDVITSGMPCETFSTAGSSSRGSYDYRQQLYSETIRLAAGVDAKLILFENVPAIQTKKVEKGGERLIVDDIKDELSKNGYKYQVSTVLNSSDFGVPQFRNRYFLLASRSKEHQLKVPIATHNGTVSVKEAFAQLPDVRANENLDKEEYSYVKGAKINPYVSLMRDSEFWKLKPQNKITYHKPPKHRENTIKRFELIEPGEGLKDLFEKFEGDKVRELQEMKILPKRWFIQRNKRLKLNEPSKTVTSHALDELVHPISHRALTVRETARLQSFPDDYLFEGGPYICPHIDARQDKYEQIGDAVPPLLAYNWGLTILDILNER